MKVSVVIPVYNERDTIHEILRRVRAVPVAKEILAIDDCSTDGTRDLLRAMEGDDLRVILHERNQGKGGALRTGFEHVRGDVVIVQDADLEYDPAEYPKLIAPIEAGKADVVYGSRFLGETHRVHLFWHYVGNRFLTLVSNMFTNLNLTDMETCYKVFRREVLEKVKIRSGGFGFDPEFTAKVARHRYRVYEVPVSYWGRDYSEGKKIGWKDGFIVLWSIVRYRLMD